YFFEIAYNGKHYAGWQSQSNAVGVQDVVEHALSTLLREPVSIVGSGRTDAGVHCLQQFFHADLTNKIDCTRFVVKLNSFLPADIAVRSIRPVKPEAHARYSAISRSYVYKITIRKDPFLHGYALHFFKSVDIKTMNKAAALLTGTHDFACFSKRSEERR